MQTVSKLFVNMNLIKDKIDTIRNAKVSETKVEYIKPIIIPIDS